MQSFSSIDSNLKKPDMFKQRTLGRRMGFRQSFQGVKLWRGSYFRETCFSVFANLGNLLYCLLSVHNVKVVFTTIKLEIRFWKGEKRFESTILLPWKKFYLHILPWPCPMWSFSVIQNCVAVRSWSWRFPGMWPSRGDVLPLSICTRLSSSYPCASKGLQHLLTFYL